MSSSHPKDYFSQQASAYSLFRPHYPDSLFKYITTLTSRHDYVWDCATGNGQAAVALAKYFKKVIATDQSAEQIKFAVSCPNVEYKVMPAEKTDFPQHCFDLITVAQALHWFNFEKFYLEVKRVLKPDGVFAAWGYDLVDFADPYIQKLLKYLYFEVLADYWPPERKYIDERYATIPFSLKEIKSPEFQIKMQATKDNFIGYLHSWSSVQLYKNKHHTDPIAQFFLPELNKLWPDNDNTKEIVFPMIMKIGRF